MKAGYKIQNSEMHLDADCVFVSNFPSQNIVWMCHWYGNDVDKKTHGEYSIGVWKVKQLKN